jgi:hypothetical protein
VLLLGPVCACRGAEWRLWWVGHAGGFFTLDKEEAAVVACVYLLVIGLLAFEVCRRFAGAAHAFMA